MAIKSIRFKPEMARAILDGRKTVTRRVVEGIPRDYSFYGMEMNPAKIAAHADGEIYPKTVKGLYANFESEYGFPMVKAPYQPGDILWVREAWAPLFPDETSNEVVGYLYKANDGKDTAWYDKTYPDGADNTWTKRWRSSASMPRKAARIFLRVTDVRVEQLQDITPDGALAEGVVPKNVVDDPYVGDQFRHWPEDYMQPVWDSTVDPEDLDIYGWAANPPVWVISFERIDKEEAEG